MPEPEPDERHGDPHLPQHSLRGHRAPTRGAADEHPGAAGVADRGGPVQERHVRRDGGGAAAVPQRIYMGCVRERSGALRPRHTDRVVPALLPPRQSRTNRNNPGARRHGRTCPQIKKPPTWHVGRKSIIRHLGWQREGRRPDGREIQGHSLSTGCPFGKGESFF